jgi:hypothetical protein
MLLTVVQGTSLPRTPLQTHGVVSRRFPVLSVSVPVLLLHSSM